MAHGIIDNSIKLAEPGVDINKNMTYTFLGSHIVYRYETGHVLGLGSSEKLNLKDASLFYDVTGYAESATARGLSQIAGVADISFSYSSSPSADIAISGINSALYRSGSSDPVAGFAFKQRLKTDDPHDLYSNVYIASKAHIESTGLTIDRVMAHELAHTIGLKHVSETDIGEDTPEDNQQFSIMSYRLHSGTRANTDELQLYDIASIQFLYGRSTHNETDTIYASFDDSSGAPRMFSIWDSGGVDEIDASDQAYAALIDLRPGYFSSIGRKADVRTNMNSLSPSLDDPGKLNISIAFGAYIENATGTSFDDFIIGNVLSNHINGGDGNDIIYSDGTYSSYDRGAGDYRQIGSSSSNPFEDAPADVKRFLDGKAQLDVIHGGAGNDYIFGGTGPTISTEMKATIS